MRVKVGDVYMYIYDSKNHIETYVIVTETEITCGYELVKYLHLGVKVPFSNKLTESYFLNTFKYVAPENYNGKLRRFLVDEEIRDIIE